MHSYQIIGVIVCVVTSLVQCQSDKCARVCDTDNTRKRCDGVKCSKLEKMSPMKAAAPMCAPGIPSCVTPFGWGPCDKDCNGGTRDVLGDKIKCNTHSCTPPEGDCKLDLVFVLDISGSLMGLNWIIMRQFVMDLIQGFKVKPPVHFGALMFNKGSTQLFELGLHDEDDMFYDLISAPDAFGSTNTYSGLVMMRNMMAKSARKGKVQQVAIVLTDGKANRPKGKKSPRWYIEKGVKAAVADKITLFAVGFGDAVEDELKVIANYQPGFYKMLPNAAALQTITDYIVKKACKLDDYDCGDNNPCTAENWDAGKRYFPYKDSKHTFIKCDRKCEMTCSIKTCTSPSLFIPGHCG